MEKENKLTGTKEWANKNCNIIKGCMNGCKYCYASYNANRFGYKKIDDWRNEELNDKIFHEPIKKSKQDEVIMYGSSHDISPYYIRKHIQYLSRLLAAGNKVLIVSKPHYECVNRMCLDFQEYKKQVEFRFTIGTSNEKILNFWEPFAPSLSERIKSFEYAYKSGYETSLSIEPMLDNHPENVIKISQQYISGNIWIGKPKMLKLRVIGNGYNDIFNINAVEELLEKHLDHFIIELYFKLKHLEYVKWKDSIIEVLKRNEII